jgi:hypothetical protein
MRKGTSWTISPCPASVIIAVGIALAPTRALGCTRDSECKGDRICENTRCINPAESAAAPPATAVPAPPAAPKAPPPAAAPRPAGTPVPSPTPAGAPPPAAQPQQPPAPAAPVATQPAPGAVQPSAAAVQSERDAMQAQVDWQSNKRTWPRPGDPAEPVSTAQEGRVPVKVVHEDDANTNLVLRSGSSQPGGAPILVQGCTTPCTTAVAPGTLLLMPTTNNAFVGVTIKEPSIVTYQEAKGRAMWRLYVGAPMAVVGCTLLVLGSNAGSIGPVVAGAALIGGSGLFLYPWFHDQGTPASGTVQPWKDPPPSTASRAKSERVAVGLAPVRRGGYAGARWTF